MEAKELKIEDVMCGDWVDVRNNASPNTPHIEKITPSHLLRDEHWYGIKLTPEILEKNGFRIMFEGELHKTYFQDIFGFAVEIKIDCIGFTKLSMSNGLGYRVAIECKHIHQLQHALKLCGINKEIVL